MDDKDRNTNSHANQSLKNGNKRRPTSKKSEPKLMTMPVVLCGYGVLGQTSQSKNNANFKRSRYDSNLMPESHEMLTQQSSPVKQQTASSSLGLVQTIDIIRRNTDK